MLLLNRVDQIGLLYLRCPLSSDDRFRLLPHRDLS